MEQQHKISELERKLEELRRNAESGQKITSQAQVWDKFDAIRNSLSESQISYVANDKNVLEARRKMITVFDDWLFEKFKNDFVSVPQFNALAENYVAVVFTVAQESAEKAKSLEQENIELREELEKLRAQTKGDML